jgi:sugar lactone lactonase YvrE
MTSVPFSEPGVYGWSSLEIWALSDGVRTYYTPDGLVKDVRKNVVGTHSLNIPAITVTEPPPAPTPTPITATYVLKWGDYGSGDGQFREPGDVAVDGAGNVYVAAKNNHRIQKFSSTGVFLTKWGGGGTTRGTGDGEVIRPEGVAVDGSGNVYVADTGNRRIQMFTSSGEFLTRWGSYGSVFWCPSCQNDGLFNEAEGVAVDGSGNVYVADKNNNRIQKFSSTGVFLTKWGTEGSGDGQFKYPHAVAVDGSGNVYVADSENNRIQKFSSTGVFLTKWGGYLSSFNTPRGVAVDGSGNVYVADSGNHRIQMFTSSGEFLTQWGSYGSGNGQFKWPYGVAADELGNVYVADKNNQRIQKFSVG